AGNPGRKYSNLRKRPEATKRTDSANRTNGVAIMIQIVPMTSRTERRFSGTSGSWASVDVAAFVTAAQSASLITEVRAFAGTSLICPVLVGEVRSVALVG